MHTSVHPIARAHTSPRSEITSPGRTPGAYSSACEARVHLRACGAWPRAPHRKPWSLTVSGVGVGMESTRRACTHRHRHIAGPVTVAVCSAGSPTTRLTRPIAAQNQPLTHRRVWQCFFFRIFAPPPITFFSFTPWYFIHCTRPTSCSACRVAVPPSHVPSALCSSVHARISATAHPVDAAQSSWSVVSGARSCAARATCRGPPARTGHVAARPMMCSRRTSRRKKRNCNALICARLSVCVPFPHLRAARSAAARGGVSLCFPPSRGRAHLHVIRSPPRPDDARCPRCSDGPRPDAGPDARGFAAACDAAADGARLQNRPQHSQR